MEASFTDLLGTNVRMERQSKQHFKRLSQKPVISNSQPIGTGFLDKIVFCVLREESV